LVNRRRSFAAASLPATKCGGVPPDQALAARLNEFGLFPNRCGHISPST